MAGEDWRRHVCRTRRDFAVLAVVAIATPNQQATLTHGFFVFLIRAVPMIVPYLIRVNLIRRAGDLA